ncbi:toll/interleukin-1 receptor domain-containing protein [Treponema rectale]|uniref:Toll/interleukin-1 receptor domain-containing protein n=1 Tax=Treponema rectale TaxID=744512 RepID=A0A7M1XMN4_9SPIR|nr:toll/interleukin-1 receptor domain-containing protein [Treponema rectale]
MSIFKCKMCGGTIEFEHGATIGVCDSCGTKQTLPHLDDDRRANLYDRANHFRRNNEFDKATAIYEQILTEDTTDAEAYWSLVLCQYGIEYVEDPATHKRVPTVNRAQFTSIFDDDNYKSALQYADGYQRELYEKEAKTINDIQKGILAISQKEEPFDVFICYKETDHNGRRTPDSVLANDLYYQLKQEGFKVFFARITLEDKLGTAYEPYIFAALNSAKVMVVLGTKPEHFNAVWVKNEWSRYLALIKKSGGKKVLIPAYRDMDPYDLPEEFSHLQAQDMSKLGFMQDLIRGIKKIAKVDEPKAMVKETVVVGSSNANVAPLLERAYLFLEDGKWQDANIYCEKVLDIDPKNAEAYLGKLMADLQVRSRKQLADCAEPFDDRENYGKVLRFGDDKLETEIRGYIAHINERNENARLTGIYNEAVNTMNTANTVWAFKTAADMFKTIPGFEDADSLAEQCLDKAEVCRKNAIYASARTEQIKNSISGCESAIRLFESISGWKDADEQIYACQRKIEEIKAKEENDRLELERQAEQNRIAAEKAAKKRKKIIAITTPIVVAFIAFLFVLTTVIIPSSKYNSAMELYNAQKYEDAYKAFSTLGYKDSAEKAEECLFMKQKVRLTNVSVGLTIKFGFYEQDNITSNGKEEIEWKVLDVEGNKALIISQYALDSRRYNYNTCTTWEKCTLRTWLNGAFYDAAFGTYHQKMIASSTVTADKNPSYSTSPGNNTTDKVFLLSITEANKYFSSESARRCQGTHYSYVYGADIGVNGARRWWLRSPGYDSNYAAYVATSGYIQNSGDRVDLIKVAVRPALWINLES